MNLHTIREITYGTIFFRLFLSIVIGGVLGLERGRKSRPAGLRTYILVCLGSTVVMMTNQYVSQCMNTGDPVRMGAQVLSGIGFIGAGSIMKTGRINALGIGYGSNITIRNITFRDCYNGHVIQVAGSDNVLIENCRFEGQSFRGSGDKTRELLQIEPGTVKGYPYTLVQNKAPSTNVTIRNCYFGGSENTPHYMAAIGTHSQQAGVKCSDIVIEDCTFDNAAYTAIHFMAYDRITIRNNIFTITSDSEQIDRYGILADTYGSFIDPTGAESTTDFTIEGNTFDVSDPKATVLEITTNNKSPKHIKNVTIKDNTLKGVNGGKAIDLYLLDNCTISGNTIEGFERPIVANSCDEQLISDTDIVTE